MKRAFVAGLVAAALAPATAQAFCGFYVSGAGGEMFNDATQVVLMRDGTRTVLSMQNDYKGPPAAFALVIPVPVVLAEGDVKTLPKEVFAKVDAMGAPRLVEYWEQDPCAPDIDDIAKRRGSVSANASAIPPPSPAPAGLGVTIEAQFTVGEYQIVILSAKDSTGLDTWLRQEKYEIPAGAEPLLRPYVEGGSKFFVAKVDPAKVAFEDGRAALSPLRFHYDSEEFTLPIRLGLANSSGTQDLIVNILARGQRYEAANAKTVTIPTNLDVKDAVRTRFGEFYAALFDATLAKHPGAVVTEYAWDASTCDPCPGPNLNGADFATLGADVLDATPSAPTPGAPAMPPMPPPRWGGGFVLTRLHARYGKELSEDLVFRAAPPIAGGREHLGAGGKLEEGAQAAAMNNFQGRYAIRHAWTGAVACANPRRGRWGGPPAGTPRPEIAVGQGLAFAPRGQAKLADLVASGVPELGLAAGSGSGAVITPTASTGSGQPVTAPPKPAAKQGCCGAADPLGGGALALLVLAGLRRRRRAA